MSSKLLKTNDKKVFSERITRHSLTNKHFHKLTSKPAYFGLINHPLGSKCQENAFLMLCSIIFFLVKDPPPPKKKTNLHLASPYKCSAFNTK